MEMIRNCRIHWQALTTPNNGKGAELLTLEEAATTIVELNRTYTNFMKFWFEFEDVVVEGKDEQ